MKISRKKLIVIILLSIIGIFILLTLIYQRTSLWKPEQSLITLLPKSPIGYLTLKELNGLVETFNKSEFGKQIKKMPILSEIKNELWWRQLVYQKLVWEAEMGGKLDMGAVNGHFGTEALIALYQREGKVSFLLITEVGGTEKLGIEAITATDAINPKYTRIKTEYKDLTINTITGYPLDFSYTFIGRIGVLSLSPILIAEVIDNFTQKSNGFLDSHPINKSIVESYEHDSNTVYLDIDGLSTLLDGLNVNATQIGKNILTMIKEYDYCTIGNHYSDGIIHSQLRIGEPIDFPLIKSKSIPSSLPEQTAIRIFKPKQDLVLLWNSVVEFFSIKSMNKLPNLSDLLKTEMTFGLITQSEGEDTKFPSMILCIPIQNTSVFAEQLKKIKDTNIMISRKKVDFLASQEYKGVEIQPVKLQVNFLLSLVGGYAILDDEIVVSTTLNGMKLMIDTRLGNNPKLTNLTQSISDNSINGYFQPELIIPEVKRYLPIATLLLSLSGQEVDISLTQKIRNNIFPLESLGPITIDVNSEKNSMQANVEIDFEN